MQEVVNGTEQPLLLTIPQVMRLLCLGRTKVYELIERENLPVMRFGRAVRVPHTSLQEWLKRREAQMGYNEAVL